MFILTFTLVQLGDDECLQLLNRWLNQYSGSVRVNGIEDGLHLALEEVHHLGSILSQLLVVSLQDLNGPGLLVNQLLVLLHLAHLGIKLLHHVGSILVLTN
jgi:hypothetical protein